MVEGADAKVLAKIVGGVTALTVMAVMAAVLAKEWLPIEVTAEGKVRCPPSKEQP